LLNKILKVLIDMLSHFVREDARNWGQYVPHAIVAYQVRPHCFTKYFPYYLVYGRNVQPPTGEDWKPQLINKNEEENEYGKYVNMLTGHLHEVNKAAGQQSEQNHDTAKR